MNTSEIITGQTIKYNYENQTYTGTVKRIREITTNKNVFEIATETHCIHVGWNGEPVKYNGFSSAIVTCEANETTNAALEIIRKAYGENSAVYKRAVAQMAK